MTSPGGDGQILLCVGRRADRSCPAIRVRGAGQTRGAEDPTITPLMHPAQGRAERVGPAHAPDLSSRSVHKDTPSAAAEPGLGEAHAHALEALPMGDRIANLIVIITPLVALAGAIVLLWPWGVSWAALALFFGMYVLTGFGVTIGYHRLFTHKSFETGPVLKAIFGVLGSMSVQGSIIHWCAFHRQHHQHSDHDGDPHSPHTHGHGHGIGGVLRGLWRAQVGWMLERKRPAFDRQYTADLEKDPVVAWIDKRTWLWITLSLAIPTVLGGLITMSWSGAVLGFLWGGAIRIAFVHHITWSVNSVCHIWGSAPFRSHDESRNNPIIGLLALGEGWHNNHHAFPTSARHGLRWWQFDPSYLMIRVLEKLGLVRRVRVPSSERQAEKRAA